MTENKAQRASGLFGGGLSKGLLSSVPGLSGLGDLSALLSDPKTAALRLLKGKEVEIDLGSGPRVYLLQDITDDQDGGVLIDILCKDDGSMLVASLRIL